MQVKPEQIDRLKVIYDQLLIITQRQGDPPDLNELHQRLRWWIEEIEANEQQEQEA